MIRHSQSNLLLKSIQHNGDPFKDPQTNKFERNVTFVVLGIDIGAIFDKQPCHFYPFYLHYRVKRCLSIYVLSIWVSAVFEQEGDHRPCDARSADGHGVVTREMRGELGGKVRVCTRRQLVGCESASERARSFAG